MYSVNDSTELILNNFIAKVKHYYPMGAQRIGEAFDLAKQAHDGQFRASGRPYITHPVTVADILIDMGLDVDTICAALLHDTVEDTYITNEDLVEKFGVDVANLVAGVTKLDKLKFVSKEQEQAENMRKMFFAMARDIRVMLIKLSDRLHNMRELQYLADVKRQRIARETLEIFAPIAGRLGISQIKCELEDSCFKWLDRETYDYLSSNIILKRQERQDLVNLFMEQVRTELTNVGITDFDISGRTKHFYSIFKKMNRGKTLEQIYDMTAIRIIVDSIRDCYAVLGAIHANWRPIQGRFKDYIAVPKPNMYQSLHTTVISTDEQSHNVPFEVQIRTHDMHKIAEYGIAAHWKYKEALNTPTSMDSKLGWVKEVLDYQTELKDSGEFLDVIRNDISNTNEVYVFTPNGEIKCLTAGANALDFAYSIHSQVGNRCVGTKINGKIMPLGTELATGDMVEVMTNANSKGPSRDWLKIVNTASAKSKIRQFFKQELKEENIKVGKSMLEREAKQRGIVMADLMLPDAVAITLKRYMFNDVEEMYASLGHGSIAITQIITKLIASNKNLSERLRAEQIFRHRKKNPTKENSIIVKGMDDLLVRISKCCSPVPGDEIVGYISRGRGVCIHRADCTAVKTLEPERIVDATWATVDGSAAFTATVQIVAEDKGDIFAEITKTIVNLKLPLTSIFARKDKHGNAVAIVSVEITNHNQLNDLLVKLNSIQHVINAYRTTNS